MKRFFLPCIAIFTGFITNAQQKLRLLSPDNTIRIEIQTVNRLCFSVFVDDKKILNESEIDLKLAGDRSLSRDLKLIKENSRSVDEIIVAQVPVSRKNIPDKFNELSLQFKNRFAVIFRAYDDGISYRISTSFNDSIIVSQETAAFRFTQKTHAYVPLIQKREDQDIFHTSFEELYPYKMLDSLSDKDYMYSPVLLKTPNGIFVALTESDLDDYPGMFLRGTGMDALQGAFAAYPLEEKMVDGDYPEMVVSKRADYLAKTKGNRNFPWRVLLIARQDKDLPANDLVYRLASPSTIKETGWIHPGKCTDEWIIDINLFHVPFRSGINTESYKYYIDFAKRFGFNRIMMDAGWSDARDLFKINPQINMDTLVAYAKMRGIGISMWTLSMTLDRQLDSALKQFKRWGVDFIMTDFIDRDDQKTVNFYKKIAEACAKEKIMIMFHGAYPPKGFNRTYPNNITREGVLGSEYNAWSDKSTAAHNCTIPFTRMLAGPLDYEPGLLDNATPKMFRPIWGKVMSQTTRCQQLAMFIVYDNPMQIFSGNPSQGWMEPEFMDLLGSFPTVWDTTIILQAKVAEQIITARCNGNNWYIGGMAGGKAYDCVIDFSFLPSGKYKATVCRDGINSDRNAMDSIIEKSVLESGSSMPIHLAPDGGFVVRLLKE
ncbi:MAG TPA: glycoside hydrolase family 97 protein [Puia sp.]|nr:glycoside hydrolase family 97 protein [Puia sp.]